MWSSTNQRIKALMSARAREKDRLSRPIHVRRADVRITFRDADDFLVETPARVMLNDLRPAGFVVYATTALNPNSEVTVEVEHPKHFRLSARVLYSQYQPSSAHVLSTQSFPYLIGVILIWKDQALEEAFTKYCAELEDLYVNKKALFLKEVFSSKPAETAATPEAAAAAAKDPNDVPPPTESDEAGPPSDEKVAAEMAADVAAKAMEAANPAPAPAAAPGAPETSAADVLNALKDIDPGTPAADAKTPAPAAEDEKKAA
jgi:hypothetical protein